LGLAANASLEASPILGSRRSIRDQTRSRRRSHRHAVDTLLSAKQDRHRYDLRYGRPDRALVKSGQRRSSNASSLCWRTLAQPAGLITTSQIHSSYPSSRSISEFESFHPSHAVGLWGVIFRCGENASNQDRRVRIRTHPKCRRDCGSVHLLRSLSGRPTSCRSICARVELAGTTPRWDCSHRRPKNLVAQFDAIFIGSSVRQRREFLLGSSVC
jgi:hypothetical protein